MNELLTTWKYALGAFSDDKTHKYDNRVCVIRSVILATYLITNSIICMGVIRHWDDNVPAPNSITIVQTQDRETRIFNAFTQFIKVLMEVDKTSIN